MNPGMYTIKHFIQKLCKYYILHIKTSDTIKTLSYSELKTKDTMDAVYADQV